MELLKELLLGIIQGITGFMPVSSTGHMMILMNLMGMNKREFTLFLGFLEISGIFALIIVMFKDIMKLIIGAYQLIMDVFSNIIIFFKKLFFRDRGGYYILNTNPYKKLVLMMVISSAATLIVASVIKSIAVNSSDIPTVIGICFILSAVILFLSNGMGGKRVIKNMSFFDALAIGIAQGVAIMPGISRVAVTFAVALALGFSRGFSIKYVYLLSIVSLSGSFLLNMKDLAGTAVSLSSIGNYMAAMIICCILSFFFLKLMLNLMKRGATKFFAVYGLFLGIIILIIDIII